MPPGPRHPAAAGRAALRDSRLPISYLTCGQSVPEDIVTADVRSLARVLLGEAKIESLHQVERRPQTNV